MGGDGAHLGVTAKRALGTILGGEESPAEEERTTPKQVKERIMQAPDPCEGEDIWHRFDEDSKDDAYSLAADAIAKAFLLAEQEKPGILHEKRYWPDDHESEYIRGKECEPMTAVWDYVMEKWPNFDNWIGGASGFMVGFAYNAALYSLEQPPAPNPAIVTVGRKGDDGS